jgi:hypothetical protein
MLPGCRIVGGRLSQEYGRSLAQRIITNFAIDFPCPWALGLCDGKRGNSAFDIL